MVKPGNTDASPKTNSNRPLKKPATIAPNSTGQARQRTEPKTAAAETAAKKIKIVAPPPDENVEFEKASGAADATEKIAALRKFLDTFPASEKKDQALELIVRARAESGFQRQQAGDMDAAASIFLTTANETPKPIPAQLFTDIISKLPANLFFHEEREKGLEIAKIIESKADTNAAQLLSLASFYVSIENGSEASRLARNAIQLEPNSSAAYLSFGLGNRMDFLLEDAASAYAKALELDPASMPARRGLAEMKRSMGRADEAAALYREILAQDPNNVPARTGLILSLFDGNKRTDADAELAASLASNPKNVILLASAAYWYAAHNEGDKAVDFGQKAIAIEPRFIWSHIALARGLMLQKKPLDAERTLLAARRYGNFPTLEYEIASARLMAGFYRDAAEELAKHFSVKAGLIQVDLGLRIPKESKYFTELVGFERRASIFAPTAADNPELANQLRALLEFTQEIELKAPNAAAATAAADDFVRGDDNMKIHRQLFVASALLDKKLALSKVLELAKAASANADAAAETSYAAGAVLASELYESRMIANARGEFIRVPDIPRQTISAILRGRIEEISGWGLYEMDNPGEAIVHLRRAVSVMPADSSWWRSSVWRLGSALALAGKNSEALDEYTKSYRNGSPDLQRYETIEALYKRVNGNADGLEAKIGPKPAPAIATDTVAEKIDPIAAPPIKPDPTPEPKAEPTPAPRIIPIPSESKVPAIVPIKEIPKPTPTPEPKAEPVSTPVPEVKSTPEPTPLPAAVFPVAENVKPTSTPEPKSDKVPPEADVSASQAKSLPQSSTPEPTPEPKVVSTLDSSNKASAKIEPTPSPIPVEINPMAGYPSVKSSAKGAPDSAAKPSATPKDLFPPVIIAIPDPKISKPADKDPPIKKDTDETGKTEPDANQKPRSDGASGERPRERVVRDKSSVPPETAACLIAVSEENITLKNSGGNLAILVGIEGGGDLSALTARSNSPNDIEIKTGPEVAGFKDRVLYFVKSLKARPGIYQIVFEMPCGKKEIIVKVR